MGLITQKEEDLAFEDSYNPGYDINRSNQLYLDLLKDDASSFRSRQSSSSALSEALKSLKSSGSGQSVPNSYNSMRSKMPSNY